MSKAYDNYISEHQKNVKHGIAWILAKIKINDIFPNVDLQRLIVTVKFHDASKLSSEEYDAYDAYFYGEERTPEIEEAFDYAWLHHIHENPHHWQHWILKEDDSVNDGDYMAVKCLDIPDNYIIEMIADWWSFSWKNYLITGNKKELYSIFDWYDAHLNSIKMHPNSKKKVEDLLAQIRDILDNSDAVI